MENTESKCAKLFAALSKAQSEIEAADKTQKNEAFKKDGKASKYADISDVIDVIREPAGKNGLSVIFNYKTTVDATNPRLWIQYIISHSSGEQYVSEWTLMYLRDHTMHGFGAGNTYYRRQLLKGIYQIPEEDDDGNSQSGVQTPPPPQNKSYPQNTQSYPQPKPQVKPPPKPSDPEYFDDLDNALGRNYHDPSPEMEPKRILLRSLYDLVDDMAVPHDVVKTYIKQVCGVIKSSEQMTEKEIETLIQRIKLIKK